MTISIWARGPSGQVERIDTANTRNQATYLAGEYQLAFGRGFKVWAGRKDEEPK